MSVISCRRQRGVGIVEALVALLVLSFGMLGIAGLYLESMKANRTALARTAAVQLVNDLADRIRANRDGTHWYALAYNTTPTTAATDCGTASVNCTPQQLAQYDLDRWFAHVKAALPKGANGTVDPRVGIVYTASAGTVPARYVIRASWQEPGDAEFLDTYAVVLQ